MSENLISIIVPVYNSENYLRAAIHSLLNQTYQNIEVILINDGSTDGSQELISSFQKKDKRIKLYNTKNFGVSHARNYGIDRASGSYIMFLDPDDTYDKSYCLEMIGLINKFNADVVMSNYYICRGKNIYPNVNNDLLECEGLISRDKTMRSILSDTGFKGFVWTRIFRKNVINNVKFNESINYLEDTLFNISIVHNARIIAYTKKRHYFYLQREDSASKKFSKSFFKSLNLIRGEVDPEFYSQIDSVIFYNLVGWLITERKSRENSQFIRRNIKNMKSQIKFKTLKMENPIKNLILKLSYAFPLVGSCMIHMLSVFMKTKFYSKLMSMLRKG